MYRACPPLRGFEYAGIQQLEQAAFIGKPAFGLGQFTELAIDGLDGIGKTERSSIILDALFASINMFEFPRIFPESRV